MTIRARWSIPEDDAVTNTGDLIVDDSGIRLVVFGPLSQRDVANPRQDRIDVVNGFSPSGKPITVIDAVPIDAQVGPQGVSEITYRVGKAVVGVSVEAPSELRFRDFKVTLSYLDSWLADPHFEYQLFHDDYLAEVRLKKPGIISFDCGTFVLEFGVNARLPELRSPLRNVSIVTEDFARFLYPEPISIDTATEDIVHFRDFLSLFVGRSSAVKTLVVNEKEKSLDTGIYESISVYVPFNQSTVSEELPHPSYLRKRYHKMRDPQHAIRQWFAIKDRVSSVARLLLLPGAGIMYMDVRFLLLIQAIEAYHREFLGEDDEYRDTELAKKQRVLDSSPAELQKWLGEKLQYAGESGLRKRLKALFERHPIDLGELPSTKVVINDVVTARNDLVHRGTANTSGHQVLRLVEVLVRLLVECLMHEVGEATSSQLST
ncbi:MAG: hypothetical protein PF508_16445 [Spirochaeta sp.]|nr:hypothetical protein [Spirochaeta sp.]